MTVGSSDSRPPRRLETEASLPSWSRAEAPERLTSPGLRSAANLRLALSCGTLSLGACQPPPLDRFDASPCCDASELCASRHPSPLDEVARPPRPRNKLCSLLLNPRFVEALFEKRPPRVHSMVLHAVLLLLPEGSNRFLERKPCQQIASLAQVTRSCRPPASSHHTRKQFSPKGQSTSQSNPEAGSLPKGRGWCRLDFEAFIHRRVRCDTAP